MRLLVLQVAFFLFLSLAVYTVLPLTLSWALVFGIGVSVCHIIIISVYVSVTSLDKRDLAVQVTHATARTHACQHQNHVTHAEKMSYANLSNGSHASARNKFTCHHIYSKPLSLSVCYSWWQTQCCLHVLTVLASFTCGTPNAPAGSPARSEKISAKIAQHKPNRSVIRYTRVIHV